MKRRTSSLLIAAIMLLTMLPTTAFASTTIKTADIPITDEYFADLAFRDFLECEKDIDGDGVLNQDEIINLTHLDVEDQYIDSLDGIQYLSYITYLNCSSNDLRDLPELPQNLEELYCADNDLTSLPELPASLTILSCEDNQLTALPKLPANLTVLECGNNYLTNLPELPTKLTQLNCGDNNLVSLPKLPKTLISLRASFNKIPGVIDLSQLSNLNRVLLAENCLTGIKLHPTAKYAIINISSNHISSKAKVTGRNDIIWDNDNYTFDYQYDYCDFCENNGHSYTKVIQKATTKQTSAKSGKIQYVCSRCEYVDSKYETIPYVKSIKLSTTSYTYNGKTKKPSVTVYNSSGKKITSSNYTVTYASGRKNVGTYKVTVNFKGSNYSGSRYATFKIVPKGTSISTLAKAKKGFTAKWKKQSSKMATSRITGYQIRYSTSSKMTKPKTVTVKGYSKTSKKITKLKAKKKYYVQVRTYKTVNGTKYYSAWSKYKSVKTK